MIRLNGKQWKIFAIDTVNTIIDRISNKLDTIPEYLYIQDEKRIFLDLEDYLEKSVSTTKIDINAKSVIEIVKKEKNSDSPEKFINEFPNSRIPQKELIKIWCAYNINIKEGGVLSFAIAENIASILGISSKEAEDIVNSSENYDKIINEKIDNFNGKMKDYTSLAEKFNNVKGIERSDFKLDSSSYNIFLEIPGNIGIMEIFNYFKLSPLVPFCSIRDYYKIYKDFKPPIDWAVSVFNDILVKVSDKPVPKKDKDYKNVIISVGSVEPPTKGNGSKIKINMEYNFNEKNIPRDEFVKNIVSRIEIPGIKIIEQKQDALRGVASFPNQTINKYVFEDLVLNNNLYSKYLSINESVKATKKRSGMYMKYIHNQDELNITITDKTLTSSDKELKSFPLGTKYVRVKISNAKDRTQIDNFFVIIGKLLAFYNILSPDITDFYRKWIPNFNKPETVKLKERNRLKDIAPEIFVSRYSKKCPLKEMPRIVDAKYVANLPREKWMLFPKSPEQGVQRYYVCDQNNKYIYPGLRKNVNLSNADKFPYLPCCYVNNQQDKNNSNYTKYYSDQEELQDTKEAKQQTVFLTNRTATSTGFGTLPKNLAKLINLINDTPGEIYRKGMSRNPGSFIECILEALFNETNFLTVKKGQVFNDALRTDKTNRVREKLANWEFLSVGKQELYDLKLEEISREINNPEIYLDPRKYIRIIEEYFNCNILLFSGGDDPNNPEKENDGMILPRFSQAYLRFSWKKDRPFILVYENWGNYTEKLKYPQVELMVKTIGEDSVYTFDYNDGFIQSLIEIYFSLNSTWNLDKKMRNIILDFPSGISPVSQYIDSYGKTRILNCKINGEIISLETDPIPPLKLMISNEIFLGNVKIPKKFGQVNVKVYLENNVDKDEKKKENTLNTFITLRKLSKYVIEYFIREFSIFLHAKGISDKIPPEIPKFVKEKIVYKDIGNVEKITFPINFQDKFFMKSGGKLILPNEEVMYRLVYILRNRINRNPREVLEYHTLTNFTNIYNEITDFKKYPNQILIKGENIIDEWITTRNKQNILYSKILPENTEPYFFSNENIKGESTIFIAQNTDTIEKALDIIRIWKEKGYNEGSKENNEKNNENNKSFSPSFNLWVYTNEKDIKLYDITGKNVLYPINILGYKNKGVSGFTVLLPL